LKKCASDSCFFEKLSKKEKEWSIYWFNGLLKDATLYDETYFSGRKLRAKTKKLLSKKRKGKNLIILNRCLLEDAYPDEIARKQKK